MSIYRKLRAKTASSISEISQTDSFLFNRWLREQPVDFKEIDEILSQLINTDDQNDWLILPENYIYSFRFNPYKILN